MPETAEERSVNNIVIGVPPAMEDLPFDIVGSWTFEDILSSIPSPPRIIIPAATPDQESLWSPLWTFSVHEYDKDGVDDHSSTQNATLTSSGSVSTDPQLIGSPDQPTRKPSNSDGKMRLPMLSLSEYQDPKDIIKERVTMALRYFTELGDHDTSLVQIWAPVRNKGRYVLTTSGQPYVLDPNCIGLHQYRMASLMYVISLDGETDGVLDLPGRVFRQKLPEWSPNVQYYSGKEYQRLNYALTYNVRGTLALPVFESSGQSCVGVLELILTSQKINYAPEVDKVCKALEAVNLKSSNILDSPSTQMCNESRQQALAEILEVLAVVCETHNLPLAQTWVPCRHRKVLASGGGIKNSCSSFDESCLGQVCMSTTDVSFYVVDAHMWGFREACAEHHLQKGQGVAGRAFATRSSCYCENITNFGKTEYPLVHYARLFGLVGSFAICLRSSHTGDDDYILEFFLPPNMVDCNDQQTTPGSLLTSMKQHFRTFKVASGEEIGEDVRFVETIKPSVNGDVTDSGIQSIRLSESMISNGGPLIKEPNAFNGNLGKSENVTTKKKSERKQRKAEKSINLELLQQHFAGSFKDAAKNLGVRPSTMKRICRQHGIPRWPSRKINNVCRSLSKLNRVIESIQGGEGTFTVSSLATTQLPLVIDSPSWPTAPNGSPTNQQGSPRSIPYDLATNDPPCVDSTSCQIPSKPVNQLGSPVSNPYDTTCWRTDIAEKSERERRKSEKEINPEFLQQHLAELDEESSEMGFLKTFEGNRLSTILDPSEEEKADECITISEANYKTAPILLPREDIELQYGRTMKEAAKNLNVSLSTLKRKCKALHISEWQGPNFMKRKENKQYKNQTDTNEADNSAIRGSLAIKSGTYIIENTLTIKAEYAGDLIKFHMPISLATVEAIKKEICDRFKLRLATYKLNYQDEDKDWILMNSEEDLIDCIKTMRTSNGTSIRLRVLLLP